LLNFQQNFPVQHKLVLFLINTIEQQQQQQKTKKNTHKKGITISKPPVVPLLSSSSLGCSVVLSLH
jgi:hypothetical protein